MSMDLAFPAKQWIKRVFRGLGLDVRKYSPVSSDENRLATTLSHFNVGVLLDVGANTGQFAMSTRSAGYRGTIVSFEPLTDAHDQLTRHAAKDPKWQVHERCAVGADDGAIDINVAANSVSSSILPMLNAHSDVAPESAYMRSEKTRLVKLDSVFPQYRQGAKGVFLKIDTQGYEYQVLQGAAESIREVVAVQLELSLTQLYADQRLWTFFVDYMDALGFGVWALLPGFSDAKSGRQLQCDAIFYRR